MSVLKSSGKELAGSGLAFLALGALMCAWPIGTTGMMCVLAGAALMLCGVWRSIGYFRKKEAGLNDRIDFAAAALLAAVGAVLACRADVFSVMVPFIFGVMILVNSVFQMQIALELKKMKYDRWWYHLAAALICGAAAAVMMLWAQLPLRVVAVTMGAAFIVDGAADLWTALYVKNRLKKSGLM